MGEQFMRFGDQRRIAVERSVCFAGRFQSGVMLRRHIGSREPLRFTVDHKQCLISGVRQLQKTVGSFLNRRGCREMIRKKTDVRQQGRGAESWCNLEETSVGGQDSAVSGSPSAKFASILRETVPGASHRTCAR